MTSLIDMEQLEKKLVVGAKIKIGKEYAKNHNFTEGTILTLIEGSFEHDNGLYYETQTAPSIWNEYEKEFDSIYHLFGNDLKYFQDCEILG